MSTIETSIGDKLGSRNLEKKDGIPVAQNTLTRKGSLENPELTTSPVSLTQKERLTQDLGVTVNLEGKNIDSMASPAVAIPSTSFQQDNTISSNKRTEFSHFKIGVSEDRNKRCRRTMEDAHSYFSDFGGIEGQGFFAIFDGHAGKQAAEWCGDHFHETFQTALQQNPSLPIPEVFHLAFLQADKELKENAGKHSGCTAIAAFLRSEEITDDEKTIGKENGVSNGVESKKKTKRVLYTANVGDARAVLCRGEKATRLSYDHKGSDSQEAKRIVDAGGFVMNNRVNGVLAVTRSLGDSSMKEFVIGDPYTTETVLTNKDPFLILACDGLWDVCEDQDAVDLIKDVSDPQLASKKLLEHALQNFSTDNLSVMVVKLVNG